MTPCYDAAAMMADGTWGNIFRKKRKDTLSEILRFIPLFRELTPKELKTLERVVHIRTYKAAEPVFLETDPGAGMYVIQSGRIDIVANFEGEHPLILSEMEAGDFFGEMALLGDTSRSATAVARQRSELIGFFHSDLLEIISVHPEMGAKINMGLARTLAERLRYTTMQLREIWEFRGDHEQPVR
jgi:CRP/FNR family transcriptional regulator, cyclic AMP receptor protein